jgi:hypothetical protein
MTTSPPILAELRDAAERFLAAAAAVGAERWTTPRAPGKWTPAQITEHVALTYEHGAAMLRGEPRPPLVPRWLQPLLRALVLPRILRIGRFGGRTPPPLRPSDSPGTPAAVLARLRGAVAGFEGEVARLAGSHRESVDDPGFGAISLQDAVRLQALHTMHHVRQLQ